MISKLHFIRIVYVQNVQKVSTFPCPLKRVESGKHGNCLAFGGD